MATGLQGHLDRITDGLKDLADAPAATEAPQIASKTRGGAMPATSALAHFSDEVAEMRKTAGRPLRMRMDLCDEGPHHTVPVDLDRVAPLKANMKENGQSTPALVRKKLDGRFEIIAGRHRKAALLELGYEEWDVVHKDLDDDQAERLTFYDNLLAPTLTDYARFMGFLRRKQSKGLTDQQLADESGVSRQVIQRLMMFQNLPAPVLAAVAATPTKVSLGITGLFVSELVKLLPKHSSRVVEAMEQVRAGTLTVGAVMKWVEQVPLSERKATPNSSRKIRVGKSVFAEVSRRAGRLVVDFTDKSQAEALEKAIGDLIDEHAQKLKPKAGR